MPIAFQEPGPALASGVASDEQRPRAAVLPFRTPCSACNSSELCLPCRVAATEARGRQIVALAWRKVVAGQVLCAEGDRLEFFYVVRGGTLKSTVIHQDGREQVCAFHIAGDVIGLDAVAGASHATTTTALDDAQVCGVAYAPLVDRFAIDPALWSHLTRLMSREIVRGHRLMLLLGTFNAHERLASFLLDLSLRIEANGHSARDFTLGMTRADIGSYLGLTVETISRTFAAFRELGLLQVDHRRIRITDFDGLSHQPERCRDRHRVAPAPSWLHGRPV